MKSMRCCLHLVLALTCSTLAGAFALADEMPTEVRSVLQNHCQDCHDPDVAEGNFGFSIDQVDWTSPQTIHHWEQIHLMLTRRIMPPAEMETPSDKDIKVAADWIDHQLMHRSSIGGTTIRRLSRREYRNTIEDVFGLKSFTLPDSFPEDNLRHGFDNQAESLTIAVSHMESFAETATLVADEFFPPPRPAVNSQVTQIPPSDLTISYSSASLARDQHGIPEMRLASSGVNAVRNATWPSKFEAPAHGRYRIEIEATAVTGPSESSLFEPELHIKTHLSDRGSANRDPFATHKIELGKANQIRFEAKLDRGQSIELRYANGPLNYDNNDALRSFLERLFANQPEVASAWASVGQPARGGAGWDQVTQRIAQGNLEPEAYQPGSQELQSLIDRLVKKKTDTGETIVYKLFDEGPYIAIKGIRIEGPLEIYPDKDDVRKLSQRKRLLGKDFNAEEALPEFVANLLSKLYRRTASQNEIDRLLHLIRAEATRAGDIDDGLHLALRTALLSPSFLFRCIETNEREPTQLSDQCLASRLSFFLTSHPPDEQLGDLAGSNRLNQSKALRGQAKRLVSETLATDFVYQWLGLKSLDGLMPDNRLIANFTSDHKEAMVEEVATTFWHVLKNNLPASELIAPDYIFTNQLVGYDIYDLKDLKKPKRKKKGNANDPIRKIKVDPASHRGGLLGMPAIMMATANGVDTQPVLRGVWMLENILGTPPPEPPDAVPALTPDTQGASTPKQRLAAHMSDPNCATCHREIDPVGFALENFDPVGRWREYYPVFKEEEGKAKMLQGAPVDASGVMPSGERISDVRSLKALLAKDPKPLVRCLSEKWMTYATGRELNYRERGIIRNIVDAQRANDYRLLDLLVALIDSKVFRTK